MVPEGKKMLYSLMKYSEGAFSIWAVKYKKMEFMMHNPP
jgi:hypothetical protein